MNSEKVTVFIEEDDEFYQEHLRYHLSKNFNWDIKIFRSGEASVDSLYLKTNIIFLDYTLNNEVTGAINGMETLRRIKKKSQLQKIVIVSGFKKEKDMAEKFIEAGAYDFIPKDDNTLMAVSVIVQKTLAELVRNQSKKKSGFAGVFV